MENKPVITRLRNFFRTPRGGRIGMWLAFFIYWGGAAAVLPFMSVFFESVNLKGGQIGQLNSIPFFTSLVSSFAFAFISDRLRKHKLILQICVAGLIISMFIFPRLSTFSALVRLVFLYSIFNAPTIPILDQTALSVLENPENYGKIRVGGSIGWGIMVLVTGFLIDNLSIGLPIIFYINIAFLIVFFLLTFLLPEPVPSDNESLEPVSLRDLWKMLRLPGFMIFLVVIINWGIGEASIQNFLFLHIKSLGGSAALMGISLSISLVGEIIVFSQAGRIQRKFGPFPMILMAYIVLIIWLTGLSLIRNPAAIPFFQIFGGSGFALLLSGSVAYVNKRSPKGLGTTAQAIRGGLFSGLGVGTGAIISGIMYEAAGSAVMFRNMAFIALGGFLIALIILSRQKKNASEDMFNGGFK